VGQGFVSWPLGNIAELLDRLRGWRAVCNNLIAGQLGKQTGGNRKAAARMRCMAVNLGMVGDFAGVLPGRR